MSTILPRRTDTALPPARRPVDNFPDRRQRPRTALAAVGRAGRADAAGRADPRRPVPPTSTDGSDRARPLPRVRRRAAALSYGRAILAGMRLTIFWERMRAYFGESYADSFARDHVMSELGGRTVLQALEDGWETKDVWRAVCAAMEVPAALR
jgi:hypothetical protein